ncbi:MAG: hypothetical protein SOZ06_03560 [Candidatus Faecenecus gallistercoris]|nr:hypothetical protein [Candidatus Faecenecus gallistercoris]
MYPISNNLKNILETTTSLNSRSKIVVDNQEYISELKSYPTISHKNSKMIGSFSAKTCSFEIYDEDNSLDLAGKEITVYRGVLVNDNIEWIPQGIFIPQSKDITTNVSTRTISVNNAQDRTQLFDDPYVSELDWSNNATHTGLEIISEICTNLGLQLESTVFPFSTYNFKQPNFPEGITYKEVVMRYVEVGGAIAMITRLGKLYIKTQIATGHTVNRNRYVSLSKEKMFGLINVVVLGKDGMNDDIVYPNTLPENKVEWKILDNPFVDLYREEMIDTVASYIIGQSIIPFTLNDFVDGFYLDCNDVISVNDKNGETFNAVILNYDTSSRIKSNVSADVPTNTTTDYNLAGSSKKTLNQVRFDVDHNTQQINQIISTQNSQSETINNIQSGLDDLVDQIDSNITYYKGNYVPTLENEPASEWTTDELKNNHLGDLFYNTETGIAYRFVKDGVVYKWEEESNDVAEAIELAENAIAQAAAAQNTANSAQSIATGAQNTAEGAQTTANNALSTANNAQNSANSKRRVFVTEPVPPYDIGDLWTDGEDIYVCKTAKTEGQTFSQDDWENTTNYAEQIDTTNVKLNETISNLDGTNSVIANLQTTLTNDYLNAEQIESITNGQAEDIEAISGQITQIQAQAGSIDLRVTEIETNGVSKVSTVTGTFDLEGLHITKIGEAMSSLLDWDGFVVKRDQTEVLTVRSSGVESENLKVRKWLTLEPARFEKVHAISDSKEEGIGIFI